MRDSVWKKWSGEKEWRKVRNEELLNLLSLHIMIVLIRAIKLQENEVWDVCRKRGRPRISKCWLYKQKERYLSEDLAWMEAYYTVAHKWRTERSGGDNLAQGMTSGHLSWTPLKGRLGYTKRERFLDLLCNCHLTTDIVLHAIKYMVYNLATFIWY